MVQLSRILLVRWVFLFSQAFFLLPGIAAETTSTPIWDLAPGRTVTLEADGLAANLLGSSPVATILSDGHSGCEGPQWLAGAPGLPPNLVYAAHHEKLVFRWEAGQGLTVVRNDSPEATSFRPRRDGTLVVVEQQTRQLSLWNQDFQRLEVLADRFEGKRLNRPNDAAVKTDGTIWFTDPDFLFNQRKDDIKELTGQYVFRYDPSDRQLTAVIRELTLPKKPSSFRIWLPKTYLRGPYLRIHK
jgi:sugar lactone lactonase YvrE